MECCLGNPTHTNTCIRLFVSPLCQSCQGKFAASLEARLGEAVAAETTQAIQNNGIMIVSAESRPLPNGVVC